MKCGENGYEIIGCYYMDKNGMKIDMKPGTTVEVDGTMHYCDNKNDNIQYYKKRIGCMKYGNKYEEGENFAKNHLRYECKNGIVDIVGCYVDETGRNFKIGESITDKHMLYSCYVENGQVKYDQHPCGLNGFPSCEVSQKQQIPIQVPTIPKPDSGFDAFSIARVGQVRTLALNSYKHV
ncbi:unnamed protein product [Onchocerca flexuosa]|uniref:MORN repeat protein n=1 Tax=Onchocerca flexuosa TaxID=387005 RepID=A0A183I5S2_9BILA|nr:unnamed protein product [Onchocerca flexuosa]